MRTQEQAFRAYYASMTDAELLQTAANRSSFIAVAQRLLAEELGQRQLSPSPGPLPPVRRSIFWAWGDHLARLARRLHHPHHPVST